MDGSNQRILIRDHTIRMRDVPHLSARYTVPIRWGDDRVLLVALRLVARSPRMSKKPARSRKPEPRVALWQVGVLLMIGAGVANVLGPHVMRLLPPPADHNEAMGRAFGQGLATVVCMIAGLALIVIHFVRRSRR
jgi:hypothetical protein